MSSSAPRGRWFATSVALHAALVLAVLLLRTGVSDSPKLPRPVDVVIHRVVPPAAEPVPVVPKPAPAKPAPAPLAPPRPAAKREPEPLPPRVEQPAPGPVVEVAKALPPPVPKPAPPVERRVARTGTFGEVEAVESASPRPAVKTAALGSFAPADGAPVPRSRYEQREANVSDAGFGSVEAEERRPTTRTAGVAVLEAGFGAAVDAVPAAPATKRVTESLDHPVEILSKPQPAYTDEARRMHVEGEVVLEVTFVAEGELRVVRVVRGLGHGLDEAAIAAAKKIEFKPARRDGRPVDHTAQLRVVFRLA